MENNNISNNPINEDDLAVVKFKEKNPKFCKAMEEHFKKEQEKIQISAEFRARSMQAFHENKKKLIAEGKIKNDWTNRINVSWVVGITVPVAAIMFIVGVSVAIFYYFTTNKNISPIANNPSPISTSKPIANGSIPIPTPTPTPSIAKEVAPKIQENNKLNNQQDKVNNLNNNNSNNKYNNEIAKNITSNNTSIKEVSKGRPGSRSVTVTAKKEVPNNIKLESVKSFYIKELETKIENNQNWYLDFFNELKSQTKSYWVIEDNKSEAIKMEVAFSIDDDKNIILIDRHHKILWVSNVKLGAGNAKEAACEIIKQLKEKINISSVSTDSIENNTHKDKELEKNLKIINL